MPRSVVSLGDSAVFRFGGLTRRGSTASLKLGSGDVLVFGGPARMMFHGVDRIQAGSSSLIPGGGRINLTLAASQCGRPNKRRPAGG
jgi:alkylated DNA repair protein (DNA oxidative demethylase)